MARIKFSGIVASIQGSIGGTTFQRSGSGYIVKNKSSGSPVPTKLQSSARHWNKLISNAWKGFTATQRDAWKVYIQQNNLVSRHNKSSLLSAYSYFQAYHQYRIRGFNSVLTPTGTPILTDPFGATLNFSKVQFDVYRTGPAIRFETSSGIGETFPMALLYCSRPVPGSSYAGNIQTVFMRNSRIASTHANIINSQYTPRFGVIPDPGQYVVARIVCLSFTSAQFLKFEPRMINIVDI